MSPRPSQVHDEESAAATAPQRQFWKVRFHLPSDRNQPDRVTLACNDDVVTCQRNAVVVLEEKFLEVARHGVYTKYISQPGEGRKTGMQVMLFPFDVLGPATEAEYRAMRQQGREALQAAVAPEDMAQLRQAEQ